jgi:hypothetical protein
MRDNEIACHCETPKASKGHAEGSLEAQSQPQQGMASLTPTLRSGQAAPLGMTSLSPYPELRLNNFAPRRTTHYAQP